MALGIWNVEAWLHEISWRQLKLWMEYAELEPFGEERADLRAGIVASMIANVNRDPRKGKPFQPSDFMPKFGRAKQVKMMDQSDWNDFKAMMIATAQ